MKKFFIKKFCNGKTLGFHTQNVEMGELSAGLPLTLTGMGFFEISLCGGGALRAPPSKNGRNS